MYVSYSHYSPNNGLAEEMHTMHAVSHSVTIVYRDEEQGIFCGIEDVQHANGIDTFMYVCKY